MKREYKLPLVGKILNDKPLTGSQTNPVDVVPIDELPGFKQLEARNFTYTIIDIDVDLENASIELSASEEFHDWLLDLMPKLRNIAKEKGWKLDKTELIKARRARGD